MESVLAAARFFECARASAWSCLLGFGVAGGFFARTLDLRVRFESDERGELVIVFTEDGTERRGPRLERAAPGW